MMVAVANEDIIKFSAHNGRIVKRIMSRIRIKIRTKKASRRIESCSWSPRIPHPDPDPDL